ncbi:3'-5' exonuclease [Dasania marina]|uniref:3'-5' exonuclease n=1 Tax=Dasania marina TaxID=471499 RepID=UPI0030DAB19D|tara:strand:+ start:16023 stop:16613 length:591 start_codon:yes stop_codon:yes gene_type:complete
MSLALTNQLLWPFTSLPDEYVVVDIESTGLFDADGAPGMVSIGLVLVCEGKIKKSEEFFIRPHRTMTDQASKINGITQTQAEHHPTFCEQWPKILPWIEGRLLACHNASFDWLLIVDHIERYNAVAPKLAGVFCSQRAAQPWAQAKEIPCSARGPSLDKLSEHLGLENLRHAQENQHGALVDAMQTANVIIRLQQL